MKNKKRIKELIKDFVYVEGGTFLMGTEVPVGTNKPEDVIPHMVEISSFSIQTTPVTQELYELVVGKNPSESKVWKGMPVTNVSFEDALKFIKKLNRITIKNYRLPTEAEWEYSSRGGSRSQGYKYAGSNDLNEVGWYRNNSGETLHIVKAKKPNELGIYDMSGNVFEYCSDWYGLYRNDILGSNNPKGPDNGEFRIIRGGCYDSPAWECLSSTRSDNAYETLMEENSAYNGFRLVLPTSEISFFQRVRNIFTK
jgi:formylglycine-generating enzyme required for sulfatase activity